jgi:hypothetical protein
VDRCRWRGRRRGRHRGGRTGCRRGRSRRAASSCRAPGRSGGPWRAHRNGRRWEAGGPRRRCGWGGNRRRARGHRVSRSGRANRLDTRRSLERCGRRGSRGHRGSRRRRPRGRRGRRRLPLRSVLAANGEHGAADAAPCPDSRLGDLARVDPEDAGAIGTGDVHRSILTAVLWIPRPTAPRRWSPAGGPRRRPIPARSWRSSSFRSQARSPAPDAQIGGGGW